MTPSKSCPCGKHQPYDDCCGVFHQQPGTAPTAEALMRSRYSAFALGYFDYIEATQEIDTAPPPSDSQEEDAETNPPTLWTGLDILYTEKGLEQDNTGKVRFAAHFKEGHYTGSLKEMSLFEKKDGQWFYVSGEHEVSHKTTPSHTAVDKVGRNDPCPCGSGKKYKKCCATK
ncbi:YchJ family protein [Marinomonas algarum]|uniref:YchJ family protein n=1 Tax=Marinomonas algarum TaxID=2883105 RepID=A0A9X1IML6_9GAMM|nr:YchJ family protein [Marinomonas algarum]